MDLLRVIEGIHVFWKVLRSLNSIFIAPIQKSNKPSTFYDYKPSLFVIVYIKLLSHIERGFSEVISREQFGFPASRNIYEAIVDAQEGFHIIRLINMPTMVIKLDFSKAYDMTNWLYLRTILIDVGFSYPMVKWII
jgi:hypothetical protein